MNVFNYIKILLVIFVLSVSQTVYTVTENKPEDVILKVSKLFIESLKTEEITPENGEQQIIQIVKNVLSPIIDFRRIAYRTMGKNYKKATTQQFLAFEEAIKKSLINTYSNPLLDDSAQIADTLSVEIRKVQPGKNKNPTSIVSTWLKVGATEKYDVVYYMYFKKSKEVWLVENVAVEGINLGISFRNQYQRLLNENNGDIDRVTKIWAKSKINPES